jgi:hypothetical protein
MSGGTTILSCECTGPAAEFQDKRYGKRKRVFNYSMKGEASCTVCSRKQRVDDGPRAAKQKAAGK